MPCSCGKKLKTKMKAQRESRATQIDDRVDEGCRLHMAKPLRRTYFNRVFAAIYICAIGALLCFHGNSLYQSTSLLSFSITLILLVSDLVLAFQWATTGALRMYPISRKEFPENLERVMKKRDDFPGLDVFICTADPYKEPPIVVVNTALSVMAYDYPAEKISVYVSDDGGSALTLFAFMEAAKFATHWLPFCKDNNLLDRNPLAYFQSNQSCSFDEAQKIKAMYERMKIKIERVLERGKVDDEYITGGQEREVFNKWTTSHQFTRQDHPTIIQVLLDTSKDKDISGHLMPNLIYVSRQKSRTFSHHFKAGALNTLLRVSGAMTNGQIILTLDCDFYSNDPKTPTRVLCYLCDPVIGPSLAFVQFPQIYPGLNKDDIYAGAYRRLFTINPLGLDGLMGPNHVGTGCFFSRRAFFGGPSTLIIPETPELGSDHVVDKPIQSQSVVELAHRVASCNYEVNTSWGSKIGFRYGSLVEDYNTGYQMQCEGWKSVFCRPDTNAFHGDSPIVLVDILNQQKRWGVGLLEVAFSRYSPLTFGVRSMGTLMGLGYGHYAFWPFWAIPITTYTFLPQFALLHTHSIFPKASSPWFFLYVFLFLGAYRQDFLEFISDGGTFKQWWNDQRMWHMRGLTCHLFGSIEFFLKWTGISGFGFNVTSKALDDEQSKRYEQGMLEFGVHSPMFVVLTLAAIINLISLVQGLMVQILVGGSNLDGMFVQILIAGFGVVNCWPIYEAIGLRSDNGRMPIKTILIASLLAAGCYVASFVFMHN